MRGRRPDTASQAEKGNPRRRAKKDLAERVRVLAEAPASSAEALSPPAMFGVVEFEGALRIWSEFAPILMRRNLLNRLDRHTLAMFCYYLDRFWSAVLRLAQDGETQKVKTIAGGYMLRDHPSVRHRDDAAKIVFDLSAKFGLSPLDRHKLIREMAGAGQPVGGLLGDLDEQRQAPSQGSGPAAGDDVDDITGFAARNRSSLPN